MDKYNQLKKFMQIVSGAHEKKSLHFFYGLLVVFDEVYMCTCQCTNLNIAANIFHFSFSFSKCDTFSISLSFSTSQAMTILVLVLVNRKYNGLLKSLLVCMSTS